MPLNTEFAQSYTHTHTILTFTDTARTHPQNVIVHPNTVSEIGASIRPIRQLPSRQASEAVLH